MGDWMGRDNISMAEPIGSAISLSTERFQQLKMLLEIMEGIFKAI